MSSEIENLPNPGKSNKYFPKKFPRKTVIFSEDISMVELTFLKTFLWEKIHLFQFFFTCKRFLSSIANEVD